MAGTSPTGGHRVNIAATLEPGNAGDIGKLALLGGAPEKAPFRRAVADFYFTNPIARASAVMAECSSLAHGGRALTAAE